MSAEQTAPPGGHMHNRETILNEPGTPLITQCRNCGLAGSRAMWTRLAALEALMRRVAAQDIACAHCRMAWDHVEHTADCPVTVARTLLASAATGGGTEP